MQPIAISVGEPSGIGPDLIVSCYADRKKLQLAPFFVLADPVMLAGRAERLGIRVEIANLDSPQHAAATFANALPVIPLHNTHLDSPGELKSENAAGTVEAIERATAFVLGGEASALVTAPIDKKALYDAGFNHPGHTEFLAELCARSSGRQIQPVMLLTGPELSCVPVTIHIPLSEVVGALTTELIVETAQIVVRHLQMDFGLEKPVLAVAGLNPHAGERGALGMEDISVIVPAVQKLQGMGIDATGPLPADTMFHAEARSTYDVALCMYHDQALIPVKTLGFDQAVNVTLGLPIIRTSPDHGTAMGLAASGRARPDSFIAAIDLAARMAQSRHNFRTHTQ
ncbi:4-hydroxythreonine-4-phosphate dehydrogenase PdxA [Aureimonas fodinaquatilis]|uniref:4-hydroxythreonine-4-phosphate dehydrogenase n=1 Tax=Aureimonas fodinaquatilis TaxID=2565783 RepID=A0A5B0DUU6_9HYPH|nr:4-hydroxythreonine-4-phosphate dehydrogenase PdxA [Aureimonas fodinaquatilis]KAA0970213.1 4-hydroxythreonine-4-phosphate dehydrogenase PdxA [Aureimonas fodinaquatilis]